MRFFLTTNASRQYKAGGMNFVFELTENVGSTWRGVLAVADEAAASALASAGIPQIEEISAEEYEAQKKTPHPNGSSNFRPSPQVPLPSQPHLGPVAVVEGNTTALPAVLKPDAAKPVSPVELVTKRIEIVDELAMATTVPKLR